MQTYVEEAVKSGTKEKDVLRVCHRESPCISGAWCGVFICRVSNEWCGWDWVRLKVRLNITNSFSETMFFELWPNIPFRFVPIQCNGSSRH